MQRCETKNEYASEEQIKNATERREEEQRDPGIRQGDKFKM